MFFVLNFSHPLGEVIEKNFEPVEEAEEAELACLLAKCMYDAQSVLCLLSMLQSALNKLHSITYPCKVSHFFSPIITHLQLFIAAPWRKRRLH